MMKKAMIACLFLSACSASLASKPGSPNSHLQVVAVNPPDGAIISELKEVQVTFSEAIDVQTFNEQSFMMISWQKDLSEISYSQMLDEIKGKKSIQGTYQCNEDAQTCRFVFLDSLGFGETYSIVVTPRVLSEEHWPLQQKDEMAPQFVSRLTHVGENGTTVKQGNDIQNSPPVLSPAGSKAGVNEVHFTEVITDPQQDWNDSSGGNGIGFDALVGQGTIGTTDEWIEIKNGRDQALDISLWSLKMNDGTDEEIIFGETGANLVFSLGGSVDFFQPDEFLIVGNPPGDMKNTVSLELVDEEGHIVDGLDVPDANADDLRDESFFFDENFLWKTGRASPLQ
ncbi:MAG TPA: hypothetical protein DDW49_04815 [Deltaproteobacteria bacterium]|nr:MAG: hypothetical protein A2048_05550 [Deltaproteobacteria bacterium GWA2_45_12]HBF12699.1 hypothetical protein [Deltaproteobacteria bacterium]